MNAKSGFWKTDWFLGVVVVLAVLGFNRAGDLVQSLERKAYDLGVQMSSRTPSDKIAIIAIDDASIANIGRWPWPRDVHAKLTDQLVAAKAKVIANTVFFFEPQRDPGLEYVYKLLDLYNGQPAGSAAAAAAAESAVVAASATPTATPAAPADATAPAAAVAPPAGSSELAHFGALLKEAEGALNTDRKLASSYAKAGNVLLPMYFTIGEPRGKPDHDLPPFALKSALSGKNPDLLPTEAAQTPIELLGAAAAGTGYLNSLPDADGGFRREPLALDYFGNVFPSLSLLIAAKSLNLGLQDIRTEPGAVTIGRLRIRTDDHDIMQTYFYKDRDGKPAFQKDSFYDVLSGKIPASKYADKIVLIGATAAGVGTSFPTPVSPALTPVEALAHSVSSILSEHFFIVPGWATPVEMLVLVLVAVYLIVLLPRLRAGMGAALTAGILVALIAVHFGLMVGPGLWLQLMLPAALLVVGHLALTTKRFLKTEAGKDRSDLESAESNRMLGLAFQGQGQLDMAFDKFRKCPLDDAVMDNLYNLALDFERKRQFNKAQSVYEYMSNHNPKFRDLAQKLTRAKTMSETIILGGGGGGRTNASLLSADGSSVEKPMLGRYQVEKELGKGAMGVVYLGKDPKIGRVVAIKTMALSQEFEADELQDVKERFFREAETAGRLNHPNIVTIFDAGEEHDLAFIAMEFLKGKDLVPFTKPDALLPLDRVVSIHARVAEALAYAHRQNVVHRDIKPANIMYELESDTVKVTDFGIARITDSSKTKTGMVLGTPSYMSPEQLSGMKIDGRSDLFSLAVSLYQMCTGRLPFIGDSMAQLMYKIANEEAPDARLFNSAIPEALAAVIRRGMSKNPDTRYQTGDEFATDLRAVFGGGTGTTASQPAFPSATVIMVTPLASAPLAASASADSMEATLVSAAPLQAAAPTFTRTQPVVTVAPTTVAAPTPASPVAAPPASPKPDVDFEF